MHGLSGNDYWLHLEWISSGIDRPRSKVKLLERCQVKITPVASDTLSIKKRHFYQDNMV